MKKLSVLLLISITACTTIKQYDTGTLTDKDIVQYTEVYKKLREKAPTILEEINKDPNNSQLAIEKFSNFEEIIKNGGFEGYPQFVYMNAKIGSIFSLIQATKSMNSFEELNESSNKMLRQGIEIIDEQLADPDVPEETKAELRVTKTELLSGQDELNENWEKNSKIANFVLEKATKIAGLIVSQEDVEAVKRNEKLIMEAYVGFQMPELPNNTFPDLKFE